MGQEFAQLREWSEERELDWYLLAEEPHQQIQNWYRDLLHLYRHNKALYELDTDPAGFEWINKDDTFRSIFSFVRHSRESVVCLQLYADGTSGLPGGCAAQKAAEADFGQ
jgi:1,4-alpha-glucan branching enzyme